jgi:uroporphyrinogen decarboxylase
LHHEVPVSKGTQIMNKREIVRNSLSHQKCEVIPHNIDFTRSMREKLREHLGLESSEDVGEAVGNYCAQLNVGSVTGPSEGIIDEIYPVKIGPDTGRDDWGVIWRYESDDDIGVVVDPPLKTPSLAGFTPPKPASRARYLEAFCQSNPDRFRLVSLSSPIFQRAWFLRGFENFLADLALNKDFVHELVDMILEYTVSVVAEAISYDIDAFFLMDDWGQQESLLISPAMWREYFKPGMQRLFQMIKDKGLSVFFHSCGNIQCLIPELIEMGLDVMNPFQPEVMDVYEIKRKYGDQLSFYGGVSTQKLLPYGTVDEVEADVREKLGALGKNGGYILAPAHAVQSDVPVENIMKLVEVMQHQA